MKNKNTDMKSKFTKNIYVFNTKSKHCFTGNFVKVGTRNRVTLTNIYGKSERMPITNLIPMTPYEAAVVSTGERIVRRKDVMTVAERQMANCYRTFVKLATR